MGTIPARNLVHAALYPLWPSSSSSPASSFCIEAEFLAAIQVLIYIAVAILLMFGIMLTRKHPRGRYDDRGSRAGRCRRSWPGSGLFLVLGFGINNHVGLQESSQLVGDDDIGRPSSLQKNETPRPRAVAINNMGLAVGYEMMTRFVVPFEVAGLLFTAASSPVAAIASPIAKGMTSRPRLERQATGLHGATELSMSNGQAGLTGSGDRNHSPHQTKSSRSPR